MPLSKYLEQVGATGWIKRLIEVAYESEYGLSPKVQSSLNLLLLISTETPGGQFEIFGESDERYKVRGGNQRIPEAIANLYPNHIELNRSLESIQARGNQYVLTFSGKTEPVIADFVVMTLPFTVLRKLDMKLEMPAVKRQCIQKLGYGINAKLMLGMKNHFWRTNGFTGLCYSDIGIPNGWDNAQLQTADNETAGLSILFGGARGTNVGHGTPEQQKDKYLAMWERIFPGATAAFNGKISRMDWPTHPHALGSYVCPTVGQYTTIGGAEQMPVGNVFFAGEHCGGDFAGFMNGAAQSGREAGEAILGKVR
jgi:monoamine oxidase